MSYCKKITISIFQSGNIIITGARSLEQINDAYSFINKVLKKDYSLLNLDEYYKDMVERPSRDTHLNEKDLELHNKTIEGIKNNIWKKLNI